MIGFDKRQHMQKGSPADGFGNVSSIEDDGKDAAGRRTKRRFVQRASAQPDSREQVEDDAYVPDESIDDYDAGGDRGKNNIIIAVLAAAVLCLAAALVFFFVIKGEDADVTDDVYSEGMPDTSVTEIYDSEGNAIYDENNSVIDDDAINPGVSGLAAGDGMTAPKEVYASEDQLKDINGVDVSAVYNVSSTDYVYDYVNYKLHRGIIDEGMELYWMDISYKDKKYRAQVPFYYAKDLEKEGICKMYIEVLNLEGGGKIISHMEVANVSD